MIQGNSMINAVYGFSFIPKWVKCFVFIAHYGKCSECRKQESLIKELIKDQLKFNKKKSYKTC